MGCLRVGWIVQRLDGLVAQGLGGLVTQGQGGLPKLKPRTFMQCSKSSHAMTPTKASTSINDEHV